MKFKLPVDYNVLQGFERKQVREQYIEQQNNLCYYCKTSLSLTAPEWVTNKEIIWDLFPKGFLQHPIHLQHNHYTGMTEGAVHNYCNAVMWQYHGR